MRQDGDLKLTRAELASAFADRHWAGEYPPVLSVDQAARLLQVPKATIYDWSSRGLLRGCGRRVGKHLRFFRDRLITRVFNEGIQSDAR
jgi:excisionase family DNA binding protein